MRPAEVAIQALEIGNEIKVDLGTLSEGRRAPISGLGLPWVEVERRVKSVQLSSRQEYNPETQPIIGDSPAPVKVVLTLPKLSQ